MHKRAINVVVLHLMMAIVNCEPHLNLYHECAKFYHPGNYMSHLPSLKLPYRGDVPIPINVGIPGIGLTGDELLGNGQPGIKIPYNTPILPTPVVKTKAISIVTKYVYKNPVCVKFSKGKNMCKKNDNLGKEGYEQLVTKEYFVKDKRSKENSRTNQRRGKMVEDELMER